MNLLHPLGNVASGSLLDIWNGEGAQCLRDALAADDYTLGCHACEQEVARGHDHLVFARHFDDLAWAGEPGWPRQIEFAMSNACNLQCVMCRGEWSSSIRMHREGLPPLPAVYGDRFFEDLKVFLPHLEAAQFAGGEPFIEMETFRVWDLMSDMGLEIPCAVITNGTQWNRRVEAALGQHPMSIIVSLDGYHRETYEAVRIGADRDRVMANVERFRAYTVRRRTQLSFTMCLMTNNWRDFAHLLLFAERLDTHLNVNTVPEPEEFDLERLSAEDLAGVVREMEGQEASLLGDLTGHRRRVWNDQLTRFRHLVRAKQDGTEVFIGAPTDGPGDGPPGPRPVRGAADRARQLAAERGSTWTEVDVDHDGVLIEVRGATALASGLRDHIGQPALAAVHQLEPGVTFDEGDDSPGDGITIHQGNRVEEEPSPPIEVVIGEDFLPSTNRPGYCVCLIEPAN